MNYTQPNDNDHQDSPKDWLNSALLFSRTLGFLMDENIGIVIDVVGDVEFDFNTKKVIVYSSGDQMNIIGCDEDYPEGTRLEIVK